MQRSELTERAEPRLTGRMGERCRLKLFVDAERRSQ